MMKDRLNMLMMHVMMHIIFYYYVPKGMQIILIRSLAFSN